MLLDFMSYLCFSYPKRMAFITSGVNVIEKL